MLSLRCVYTGYRLTSGGIAQSAFFIGVNAMRTKVENMKWSISATSGMIGADIDSDFIRKLSDIELLHFELEIKKGLNKCKNERDRRGI